MAAAQLFGCASAAPNPDLTIAAAASLAPAFDLLGTEFSKESGIEVIFSYAATGHLAQQIRNGGPFDIFASADAASVEALIHEGYLRADTRTAFATGRLIMLVEPGVPEDVDDLTDLTRSDVTRIAIANPTHAPYGRAARAALQSVGIWEAVQGKLVYGESVRQAGQFVETGNASVALVSASIVPSASLRVFPIPAALYPSVEHLAAVLESSKAAQAAARFLSFLTSEKGSMVLLAHGLDPLVTE